MLLMAAAYYATSRPAQTAVAQASPPVASPAAATSGGADLASPFAKTAATANAGPAQQATPPTFGTHSALRAALNSSSDYQNFVQHALAHPEQGGVLYAMSTAQACAKMQDVSAFINLNPEQLNLNPLRAQAVAQFKQRCNVNPGQILNRLQQDRDLAGRDPLWKLEADLQSGNYDKRKRALQAALDSQDPQLLFDSQALSYTPGNATEMQKTFFNGNWLSQQETQQYRLALRLAACDFGQLCQQGDLWLQEKCVIHGECAQSRQEYMERFIYPLQAETRAGVEKFRRALGKAVQTRATTAFMPG